LQSRYSSLDAARLGKAFVNSFRSQLRMPADNLMHSIRLCWNRTWSNSKEAGRIALENALVVQASVQEDANDEILAKRTSGGVRTGNASP